MLSFRQYLIEAPSWEDRLRQIGHVARNPDLFGVERAAAETDPILIGGFTKDLTFDDRLRPFPATAVNKVLAKAAGVLDPNALATDLVTRNLKPGPAIVARVVGGLAGDHIVKPAAEKAGVFDAVGTASKAAFERMSPAAVDAADKALGAAQFVLNFDPFSTTNEFLANQARQSKPLTPKQREEAEARFNRSRYSL